VCSSDLLNVPSTTLSFHLSQLAHADLIQARREGRSIFYAAAYPTIESLLRYLIEDCCQGVAADIAITPAGCGPQIHAKE